MGEESGAEARYQPDGRAELEEIEPPVLVDVHVSEERDRGGALRGE